MKWIAIAVLGFSLAASGQNAKVIQLSPADAAEAKSLYAQREALDKKIEALREKIQKRELWVNQFTSRTGEHYYTSCGAETSECSWLLGWPEGKFLYSEDFRFIVPNAPSPAGILNCGLGCGSNWITTTPAIGTLTN